MKDELKNKLIEWVERLGDIASEQLPDFAQQIVIYEAWQASIWMHTAMVFLIIFGTLFLFSSIICFFGDKSDREVMGQGMIFLILLSIIPTIIVAKEYSIIKKCEVAPKLVIIDYIRRR